MIYNNFYKGIGRSKYDQTAFDSMVNVDVHSVPGEVRNQLALTSESATPSEACISIDDASGNTYFFSTSSGKIWKRDTSATYTLFATNPTSSHTGCGFFNGDVYFSAGTNLGKLNLKTAVTMTIASPCVVTLNGHGLADDDPVVFNTSGALPTGITAGTTYYVNAIDANTFNIASTPDGSNINTSGSQSGSHSLLSPDWAVFTKSPTWRPMKVLNLSLFIGNDNYVAAVDSAGTFSDNALDLPDEYQISSLSSSGTDLVIGTIIGANVSHCKVFLWDTYSSSWTIEDDIPEVGVNSFMEADNILFAQCGTAGNVYYWTGGRMEFFKKIRGITTATNPYLTTVLNGKPLIASATKIFSIYRSDRDLPWAIVQEYTTTTGTIKSIIGVNAQLLVSNGTNIDKIGTNYATATIDTPESYSDKQYVKVKYDTIGTGASIGISTMVDNAGSYTSQTVITDTVKKTVFFDGGLGQTNFKQGRITMTPATSNYVGIKSIEL